MFWFPREFRENYEAEIVELLSRDASISRRLFDTVDLLIGAVRMQVRVTVRKGAARLWRVQRFSAMTFVIFMTTMVVAAPLSMSERMPVFTRISPVHSAVPQNCASFDRAVGTVVLRCYR
jgi:hypothetical protein